MNPNQPLIEIPVLYGSFSNITKLDLSFINAKVVVYKGSNFRKILKAFIHPHVFLHSYTFATRSDDENRLYEDKTIKSFAIVPLDYTKTFDQDLVHHFYQLLLSLFPSDLAYVKMITFLPLEEKYQCGSVSTNPFKSTGEKFFDNFLAISGYEITFINNFLRKYFEPSLKLKYVKYMLGVYSGSFIEYNPIYQFISLMICLEVIVEGKEQLTYKLKRNTAILCGDSLESCWRIYQNLDQLYKLRSAIVHGEIKANFKNFKEYYQYLKKLVARLIRELIVHNSPDIAALNAKLTETGFGQNHIISKDYKPSKHPEIDNLILSFRAIQKY